MKFEEGIGEVELIRADPTDSTDSECQKWQPILGIINLLYAILNGKISFENKL